MNEPHDFPECDPLEAELAALRPHGVSAELSGRIAGRLSSTSLRRARLTWSLAIAVGLTAASVAGAFVMGRLGNGDANMPRPIVRTRTQHQDDLSHEKTPSVWAYQLMLARSPEALDDLLDEQSQSGLARDSKVGSLNPFTRSPETLHALLGDDK